MILLLISSIHVFTIFVNTEPSQKLIAIYPNNSFEIKLLEELTKDYNTDVWNHHLNFHPILVALKDNQESFFYQLKSSQIKFNIISSNLDHFIKDSQENASNFRYLRDPNFFSKYHNLDEIKQYLNKLNKSYPGLIIQKTIGKTYENRKIISIELGKYPRKKKPTVLIECGIHAREWISPAICLYIIADLVKSSQQKSSLLSKYNFAFLPVLNPDGYAYTWSHDRLWRKNRSPNSNSKCFGVDLNRNFDSDFCKTGSSKNPCSNIYCGPKAFSEFETCAYRNYTQYLNAKRKLVAAFCIHSFGQEITFPFGFNSQKPKNYHFLKYLSYQATKSIYKKFRTNYKYGQTAEVIYLASGGSDDWMQLAFSLRAIFTIESKDEGQYGFLLPSRSIIPASKEAKEAIYTILKFLLI